MAGDGDNAFAIVCDLNRSWKLGQSAGGWQLWKRDPHTLSFQLEASVTGSRRALLREIDRRAIMLTREAEDKLKTLPETLQSWPVERGGDP